MKIAPRFRHLALYALLLSLSPALTIAQGHSDHDRDNHGQAKRDHDDHDRDHRGMPPGQAKKYFHDQDRDRFYSHYRSDADHWRGRRRPVFVVGQPIERTYVVRPVPRSVWVNTVAPPPPGYSYGYYGGYVVAYNPTTRIIADVLDIVGAAQSR
jgi:hypothetical protein